MMNVTANISDDTLHLAFSAPHGAAVEKRTIAVVGVYGADGKLLGVDIPNIGDSIEKDVAQDPVYDKEAAEREFQEWRKLHPPLASPGLQAL